MTTFIQGYTTSTTFAHSSTAAFRAWGSAVSDAMTSVGLAKTADTGQIDWASVTIPSTSSYGGYEIRRMSDASDSTYPIYMKIEYGTGSPSSRIVLRTTIGTGSNGSGTITGTLIDTATAPAGAFIAATTQLVMCRTGGAFWFAIASATTGVSLVNGVFRSQDQSSGVFGADLTHVYGASTTWAVPLTAVCVTRASGLTRSGTDYLSLPWPAQRSGTTSGRLVAAPIFAYPQLEKCDGMLAYRNGELTPYQTFQATPISGTRTYMALPTAQNTNLYHAFVWE